MPSDLNAITRQIRDTLVDRVGPSAWRAMPDADRVLVETCCADAAGLQLAALAAGGDVTAIDRIAREKWHIDAQLASLTVAAGEQLRQVLWEVTSRLLIRAATVIGTAAIAG